MRQIEEQGAFKRDYKRMLKAIHKRNLDLELEAIVTALAEDLPLIKSYREHKLSGTWSGFFCCHMRPDLVLIYRKAGKDKLELVRLGSHAELRL